MMLVEFYKSFLYNFIKFHRFPSILSLVNNFIENDHCVLSNTFLSIGIIMYSLLDYLNGGFQRLFSA